jgi:hypothetical protein
MEVGTIICAKTDLYDHLEWLKSNKHYDFIYGRAEALVADLGLPPRSFQNKWGMTQNSLFEDLKLPCYIYVGPSTRKEGKPRSRVINHQGKKKVVFEDEILCAGKLHIESDNFQRWIPVETPVDPSLFMIGGRFSAEEKTKLDTQLQKKKVVMDDDFGLIGWSGEKQYLRFQMRWAKSLMQIVPDDTKLSTYLDDAQFTVGLPAVQKANGKFYASGIGVGWLVDTVATYNQMSNAHMNKYQQAKDTIQRLNAQQGTYYVPMSYVRTHFRWDGDPYPQAGLAINWPVTGFLHLIKDYSPSEPNFI